MTASTAPGLPESTRPCSRPFCKSTARFAHASGASPPLPLVLLLPPPLPAALETALVSPAGCSGIVSEEPQPHRPIQRPYMTAKRRMRPPVGLERKQDRCPDADAVATAVF